MCDTKFDKIITGFDEVADRPYQFIHHAFSSGQELYRMEVEETREVTKANLNMLLGQLYSEFPQYPPPSLDESKNIQTVKMGIILHYSNSVRTSRDMNTTGNIRHYFKVKDRVDQLVEEYLPESLWADVAKKYKEIGKKIEEATEKYSESQEISSASDIVNVIAIELNRCADVNVLQDAFDNSCEKYNVPPEDKDYIFRIVKGLGPLVCAAC